MHPDSKVCVDFTYKPNDPNRFVHVDKKLMINVYEKHDLQPNPKADTDLFDALVIHTLQLLRFNAFVLLFLEQEQPPKLGQKVNEDKLGENEVLHL